MSSISVLSWTCEGTRWLAWVSGTELYVAKPVQRDDQFLEWELRLQNILAGTDELIAVTQWREEAQRAAHEHAGDCGG